MPARRIKSLGIPDQGHAHREHRSTKGRNENYLRDKYGNKRKKFLLERSFRNDNDE